MTRTAQITTTVTIDLDIETGAKWFAALDDDSQCRFFVAVAEEAKKWPGHPDMQWCQIGQHLAECHCSTPEARDMIAALAGHMQHYLAHPTGNKV